MTTDNQHTEREITRDKVETKLKEPNTLKYMEQDNL